jgi:cell division protein FtsL
MSQRAPMMSGRAKTHTSLTTVADQSFMRFCGRIEHMLIASFLFIAFVVAIGAIIVKTYEWHHDVLYGPYLNRID